MTVGCTFTVIRTSETDSTQTQVFEINVKQTCLSIDCPNGEIQNQDLCVCEAMQPIIGNALDIFASDFNG